MRRFIFDKSYSGFMIILRCKIFAHFLTVLVLIPFRMDIFHNYVVMLGYCFRKCQRLDARSTSGFQMDRPGS